MASSHDWFVDDAADAGLRFVHFNGMSGQYYFPEMLPGGVALLDYDKDGDLDVYFTQATLLGEGRTMEQALIKPAEPLPLRGRLYRNDLRADGDGTRRLHFTDVTEASGIDARGYGMGVATGDFDNNGCVDLYLTFVGRNQLHRNNCDGTFTDVSKSSGTDGTGWAVSAAFVDYDRDGWLDLYVGNYVQYETTNDKRCTGLTGRRDYCTPKVYAPQPDRLYHNERNGRFTDVTGRALKGGPFGPALGVVTADFDNDGWPDIYVANDGGENLLWMNRRNGTFENVGLLAGAALSADGKPEASMGVDAGDFDNDGDEDLFMTHLPVEGNDLYVNNGAGVFDDDSARTGLGPASLGYSGFGTAWFDFDNDGWLDLLIANGAIEASKATVPALSKVEGPAPVVPAPPALPALLYAEQNKLFRNLGNGHFADVTSQAGDVFTPLAVSRGAAFGDLDNDGDMDVVIVNLHSPAVLLINNLMGPAAAGPSPTGTARTSSARPHWLGLRLVTPRGSDALGARVEVRLQGGRTLWRRARSDGSYASANDPRVLVGLGDETTPPTVRVRWPNGEVEEWPSQSIDQWTTLTEGRGRAVAGPRGAARGAAR